MEKSQCIINLATGHYIKGQQRLKQSLLNVGFKGDFLGWTHESEIGAPSHKIDPYAFKCYGFQRAYDIGYTQVLWVDASVYAVKPVEPIFEYMEKHGHICQEAGHMAGTWSNDRCLEYFNLTRDEALEIVMIGNAGFLGLDLNAMRSGQFLNRWMQASKESIFRGKWSNDLLTESQDPRCKGHRHDMSCSSIIANQLSMEHVKGNQWLEYKAPETPAANDSIILGAQGL